MKSDDIWFKFFTEYKTWMPQVSELPVEGKNLGPGL